jgi:hypothetical protein
VADANVTKQTSPIDDKEFYKLIEGAQNGDKKTLPALRKLLEDPVMVDALGGDLALQTTRSLIDAAAV